MFVVLLIIDLWIWLLISYCFDFICSGSAGVVFIEMVAFGLRLVVVCIRIWFGWFASCFDVVGLICVLLLIVFAYLKCGYCNT